MNQIFKKFKEKKFVVMRSYENHIKILYQLEQAN
jgi:hypothetical protein